MEKIQWVGFALGFALQVLLLWTLVRGGIRRYPFLLILITSEFLNTVIGVAATMDLGRWTRESARYWVVGETLQFVLIFACQIHLLYQVMERGRNRGRLLYVISGGLLYAFLSVWLSYDKSPNLWMTQLVRNFNFGSMCLNVMLWTLLLRRPERSTLLITAGFGIQLAGGAIGHSLRQLSPRLVQGGNLVLLVCYLLFLLIVWRGVRTPSTVVITRREEAGAEVTPAQQPEHNAMHRIA